MARFTPFTLLAGLIFVASSLSAQVNIVADTSSGCAPLLVSFRMQGTIPPGATAYLWDFGDGGTSRQQQPSRIYSQPGTYSVTLRITFGSGPPLTVAGPVITAFQPPGAGFTGSPLSLCKNEPIRFTDTSIPGSGPVTNWLWSFGDGNISTSPNPTHRYSQGGIYTVSLSITDANQCSGSSNRSNYVRVNWPNAGFTANQTSACNPPLNVAFQPAGLPAGTHFWDFGDGNTSPFYNPAHTYQVTGSYTVTHIVTDTSGCSDTVKFVNFINVGNNFASLTASPNPVCPGSAVQFDCGLANPLSVQWTFGNLGTSNACNPLIIFNQPGIIPVTLVVTDITGCQLTASTPVVVTTPPRPSFFASNRLICNPPLTVNFINNTIAPPRSTYVWDLGDGTVSTAVNPIHTYTQPGFFDVKLIVVDPNGCTDSLIRPRYIEVGFIRPGVLSDVARGCKPLLVNFMDGSQSNSAIVSWLWRFGDGDTSMRRDPSHTYQDTGYYDVTLVLVNANGCTDSMVFRNYIGVGDTVEADFRPGDSTFCASDSVGFTNLSTGNINFVYWDFGDGTDSRDWEPFHWYQDTGYFDVTLTVADRGCADTLRQDSLLYVNAPIARFQGNLKGCDTPHTVFFLDNSIAPHSWKWNFGTGNPGDTSRLQNPIFTYRNEGQYPVTLAVKNDSTGCSYKITQNVAIQKIKIDAQSDIQSGCRPLPVQFSDSSLNPATYLWDFGDGGFSFAPHPFYTYRSPGIFTVDYTIWNSIGCTDDTSFTITVMEPQPDFAAVDTNLCAPEQVFFNNFTQSVAPVTNWFWNFGNGTTSTSRFPNGNYTAPGHYPVTLSAIDSAGCSNSLTRQQYIFVSQPIPNFTINHPVNCRNNPISFANRSIGQSPLSFFWNFGDGATSTQRSPVHGYTSNGIYTVTLTVWDTTGCDTSFSRLVTIADPVISLTADTTSASCPPLLVNFRSIRNSIHTFANWNWDFGDGNGSMVQNPSHVYTAPGIYTVRVIGTTAAGCMDTFEIQNLIDVQGPSGSFTFNPKQGCPNLTVNFNGQYSSTVTNLVDMNDGTVLSGNPILTNFSYTYRLSGTYRPAIILDDGKGCRIPISSTDSIVVFPKPTASFNAIPPVLCDTGTVLFQDQSTSGSPITNWRWEFGDGSTSNLQNPAHFYAQPDTYDVRLIVTNVNGCADTIVQPNQIIVRSIPSIRIGLNDTADCVPFNLQVQDLSPQSNSPIQNWLWNFGYLGNVATTPIAGYTYPLSGRYRVSLRLTDIYGCSNEADTNVTVWSLPEVNFIVEGDSFGCAPYPVQFRDLTPGAASWSWSFGDGNGATDPDPSHVYQTDGRYSVSLQVVDSNGCVGSRTKPNYLVLDHPVADFAPDQTLGCPGLTVTFTDQSQSDTAIVDWAWDFGDGNTGSGPMAQHTYNQDGLFDVQLIVTDVFGCRDTIIKPELIRILLNVQPMAPPIRFVSVIDAQRIRVQWEAFPNPLNDFDRYELQRLNGALWQTIYSTNDIQQITFTDKNVQTEDSSYCYRLLVVNYCENVSETAQSIAHCSILLTATPQTGQIFLDWTAYQGWARADSYHVYRVLSYSLATTELIARVPGGSTSFVDTNMFCYDQVRYRVEALHPDGRIVSWSNMDQTGPLHAPVGDPMHMVRATVEEDERVLLEWSKPYIVDPVEIVIQRDAGQGFRPLLRQSFEAPATSLTDNDINVHQQTFRYRGFVIDSCGDALPFGREAGNILLKAERDKGRILLDWTPYQQWTNGVERYEIDIFDNAAGRFVPVATVPGSFTAFDDQQSALQQKRYCYRVRAFEKGGTDTLSLSNQACVRINPEVFAPNAFSPNGDGFNEEFVIKGSFIGTFHLRIFNRWGELLFESFSQGDGWDGTYEGENVPEGVYVFLLEGRGYEQQPILLRGTVTLLR